MFTRLSGPAVTEAELARRLHPELARWFRKRFKHFAPAQLVTVPEILSQNSVLLSSPTGSGKTLAAFLAVFDYLAKAHESNTLTDQIAAVYVSPLRALAYDLRKNLQLPLEELGWNWLHVGARTGDTTPKERAAQKRRPPHILVTTPESLTLMLSQPSWIAAFSAVRFLIVDELHALAENKRGALLMVGAERLEDVVAFGQKDAESSRTESSSKEMTARLRAPNAEPIVGAADGNEMPEGFELGRPPRGLRSSAGLIRIGLSATVSPLEVMAEFLMGPGRSCGIAEVNAQKPARIEVFSPLRERAYPPAGYTATRVLKELGDLLLERRTTLIFTNTRSGAETIGLRLKQALPKLAHQIEVHHASLDRSVRLQVEDRLKLGELRAVVCSTSLEMGIDIGSIDTVVMVSAPKGVARALQRLGRSGHSMGRTSHGVLVASNINDLAECAVTARMMERRALEPVKIHDHPLDVLAQTIVGLAIFGSDTPDEAFALVRRSYPFRDLSRPLFDRVLRYLEGGGLSLEKAYRSVFGKVHVDLHGCLALTAPKVARSYYQNIGTISADNMIQVQLGRRNLGQVEESFMKGLRPGDVFVLNGRCVRLVETRLLTAKVTEAKSSLPTVPRWNANKMPLASGLADEVRRLRTVVAQMLRDPAGATPEPLAPSPPTAPLAVDSAPARAAGAWLKSEYGLSAANVAALMEHFLLQAHVSAIPTSEFFLIECYADRELLHYFFHSLIGRSANDALSRIVAQRVQETKGGNALVTIDDYGFLLTLKPFQAMTTDEWRPLFRREGAEDALRMALAESNLVKWQFRGVAQTGLMVPRRVHGAQRGAKALQWSSEIIFDVLRRYEPDHPLLMEAYAEATLRFLDLPRAMNFLESSARQPWHLREINRVSPFSFGIFVSKIKETMTLEDPETTIERLYHEMYGTLIPTAPGNSA